MGKLKRTKKLLKVAKILKKNVIAKSSSQNKNPNSPQNEPSSNSKKLGMITKNNCTKPSNKAKRHIAARESER